MARSRRTPPPPKGPPAAKAPKAKAPKAARPDRINGHQFHRALKFTLLAAPSDKGHRLAHVVLLGDRMVAADGRRWHVGQLPDSTPQPPVAVTLESARELLLGLDYASRMAKRHGGGFFVGQEADRTVIFYGDRQIVHDLVKVDVRHLPDTFLDPVPPDAPPMAAATQLDAEHVADATSWKGKCTVGFRGKGGLDPVRVEITHQDQLVGLAFILPVDRADAQLVPDEPLLLRTLPPDQRRGQSVLDLQLELHLPAAQAPSVLVIGEAKLDTSGLPDPLQLAVKAPCGKEGHDPAGEPLGGPPAEGTTAVACCFPCTLAAVNAARDDQQREAAKVSSLDAARQKRGKGGKGPGKGKGPAK